MKLISFLNQGVPSYGVVTGDDVLDLTPLLGSQAPDLKTLIAKNLLAAAAQAAQANKPTLKFSQLELLPVIRRIQLVVATPSTRRCLWGDPQDG